MIDVRLFYPNATWDDIKLQVIPRTGELVSYTAATGRNRRWKVSEVEWFIDHTGEQSAVLTLTDL